MTTIPPASETATDAASARSGLVFAFSAYGLWGVLPAFFLLLAPAAALEVVGWRVVFTLAVCALLLVATRSWGNFVAVLRSPRLMLVMGGAGILIFFNWLIFIFAAQNGQVLATSLGYFINPLFTVLLGVLVLRERLRPLQWTAVGLGAVAIVVLALAYGEVPWIALGLATTFGLYSLIKKQAGTTVGAASGLAAETLWLVGPAVILLVVLASGPGLEFGRHGALHTTLLVLTGLVTAVPLVFFAAGARRLPLVTIGLIQYVAPIMSFIMGAFVLDEHMPAERWAGFAIVWAAILVLTVDMLRRGRLSRRALPELS